MQEKIKTLRLSEREKHFIGGDNEKSLLHMFDKNLTLLTVNILENKNKYSTGM